MWRADDPEAGPHPLAALAPLVATQPGGKPVHQLPEPYRLARYAATFGVRPEDLAQVDGGHPIGSELADGIVTVDHAGADPYAQQIAYAAYGSPGGRLIIRATRPDVPTLPQLIQVALGLHLAVTITLTDHLPNQGDPRCLQGESWDIEINPAELPAAPADPPTQRTPAAAIENCLRYLENATVAATPLDPGEPVHLPQTLEPATIEDPTPLIRQLARYHAGQPVAVHYVRTGCQLHLRERDHVRHLATAGTLTAALTALGLR